MKLLIIAIASIGILIATIIYSDRPSAPPIPPITNPIHAGTALSFSIYNPDDVTEFTWQDLKLKKHGELWTKISGPPFIHALDQWGTQRRVMVFSRLQLVDGISVTNALGKIEITVEGSKEKISGVYDHQNFQFISGPEKNEGFHLASNKDLQEIIYEGLWGFYPHKIELCRVDSLKKVDFKDWSIEKTKDWFVIGKNKKERARLEPVRSFLNKICHPTVDFFSNSEEPGPSSTAMTLETTSSIKEVKKYANTFSVKGFQFFRSRDLADALSLIIPEDLRDPTSEEAKTAIDKRAPQEARIGAIRKLRGNNSREAISALREIVFETTDIDLYRYEAVDTLAETGTKESFKVLIDRLPEVGRSGFELRIARALAGAMGTFFKSDEKTPEEERRPEVDALVQMALKKPPGK